MRTRRPFGRVSAFRRSPLFVAIACALAQGAMAGVYTVSNGNDFGGGSLRDAINQANANCGIDSAPQIQFTAGPFTISPSSPLPAFQCTTAAFFPVINAQNTAYGATLNSDATGFNAVLPYTLDGTNNFYGGCGLQIFDNGYGGSLGIYGMDVRNFNTGACGRLNVGGSRFAKNVDGLSLVDGSGVGGYNLADRNVIVGGSGWGVAISDGNYSIVNNLIGTPDGVSADPNDEGIASTYAFMTGQIYNNVIVSSGYANIDLAGDQMSISNNRIGTNASGTAVLGSSSYGIALYYSYGSSIFQNTIAGARQNGIDLYYGDGVNIVDNRIGVTSDGSVALGNSIGIYDENSSFTDIYGNEISGNANFGVWLHGTSQASVDSNFIGTNYGGTLAVPNGNGVYLGLAATASFDGNIISGNAGVGVWSSDASNIVLTNNVVGAAGGGGGALPNGAEGFLAECGGFLSVSGNTFSNNGRAGLSLSAISSSSFSGNSINKNGSVSAPANGVELTTSTCVGLVLTEGQQRTGGKAAAAAKSVTPGYPNFSDGNTFTGNTVSNNTGDGIAAFGASSNTFDSNIVFANTGDGIRLDSDSVPHASTGDRITQGSNYGNGGKNIDLASLASNNGQPRPTILSAVRDASKGETLVTVQLTANAGTYHVELFRNSSPGKPAGEIALFYGDMVLAAPGTQTVAIQVNDLTSDNFSATATHVETGDTSEFADIFSVGALPVPAATVLPTSIDFGDVVVGRASASGTITVNSTGTGDYLISALRDSTCSGTPVCTSGGAFACSTSCLEATPYSNGMSCTITASFTPTATGPQSKALALCDNTVDSPRALTFTGNGIVAPVVDVVLSPANANFGDVLVGTQSAPRSFALTNMGSQTVYVGNAKASGDFSISGNSCGPTLSAGASCTTEVTFIPTSRGLFFEKLELTASDAPIGAAARAQARGKVAAAPVTVVASANLQGSGVQFGDLRLPASLPFGTLVLHASAREQTVTLSNGGNGVLTIGAISITGPFSLSNPCPATLAPGASCTLTLGFNPLSLGSYSGTLNVSTDAPGGVRAIPVSALVIADARPVVRANPTAVGFGDRVIGVEAPAARITITNEGAQLAQFGPFAFVQPVPGSASEYSIAGTTCGATLAPQASCFVDLVLKPLGFSQRNGQFIIPSNSADSPLIVSLGGTGCRPYAAGGNRSGRDLCGP